VRHAANVSLVAFEVFKRRAVPRTANEAFVTIQRKGVIAFSRGAYESLGGPAAIELLYDAERQVAGFRSIELGAEHAYPVRVNGKKTSHMVSGILFTRHYGIPTEVARRWPAYLDGAVLCIDLSQPGQETGSAGSRLADEDNEGGTDFPSPASQAGQRGKEQGGAAPKPTTSGSRSAPPMRHSPKTAQRSRP
jgi:hypothetical protein